ncbi:glycerate kinase type-2 family protein [Roseitranquillus sediminis]|uniref:glycerate kinase type-2 family protein n=1 Tax=Roseitranquillus sediminis TaxID=2809051 RepID=UPI002222EFCE|nr:glycerate kinase [Roseitranquillus sediminis]
MFHAALAASLPEGKFEGRLPSKPAGRTIVLGAGKAAASMAAAFEKAWGQACEGLVITRYDHGTPTRWIEVVEAGHPVPDEAGLHASRRILDLARTAGTDDLVVVLISGGASALLTMPLDGLSLDEKQDITRSLLRSGASISAMNCVRKALSGIKGGRLALAAAPARVVTYIISDVPSDDPADIGSGPSVVQAPRVEEALAILNRYDIPISERVEKLMRCNSGEAADAPSGETHLIATPRMALVAAAETARKRGIAPLILGDAIEGEAREAALVMAGIASSVRRYSDPIAPPCVLLSGGETTVTVHGDGRGGRNAEFLLALAIALKKQRAIAALACDTDGIDGSENNAGAWLDDSILDGRDWSAQRAYLQRNDAYGYFQSRDRLVVTRPTLTNVNDFRAILIR